MKRFTALAMLYALVLPITLLTSCRKEKFIEDGISQNRSGSGSYGDYVSYNSTYNVLIFQSFDDVLQLEMLIKDRVENFPLDLGNTSAIAAMISQIKTRGYTTTNEQGKVKLSDFGALLNASYPLSDQTLISVIELHDQVSLPSNFIRDILIANVPFTYTVRNKVDVANITTSVKDQIKNADEDKLDFPNHAYNEFLRTFPGYHSLYGELRSAELTKLSQGADPTGATFDTDVVQLSFERLIFNKDHEIYVGDKLYKLYDSCKTVAFEGSVQSAYQQLNVVGVDGNVAIPTLQEGPQGLSESVMNQHVPSGFMVYNPTFFDPMAEENGNDPNYNTALQIENLSPLCPISNFTYSLLEVGNLSVEFTDVTNFPGAGNEEGYYQYWNFGDGSGSFLDNPTHNFPAFGTYQVSLTTFSQDCGCWHVHKIFVHLTSQLYATKDGNPSCPIFIDNTPPQIDFSTLITVNGGTPAILGSVIQNYNFTFYDEDPSLNPSATPIQDVNNGNISFYNFVAPSAGTYYVVVLATWSLGGCLSEVQKEIYIPSPNEAPDCCDLKNKEKPKDETIGLPSGLYKLKIVDISRGTFGAPGWRKIAGEHKVYKVNNKGKWKQYPAQHCVIIIGDYWLREDEECTTLTSHFKQFKSGSASHSQFEFGNDIAEKFGLKTESLTFTHSIYIGGTTITSYGNCSNAGGITVFDDIVVKLGECD